MSNDTTYSLVFRHAKRKCLEQVVKYLEAKKARWDEAKEHRKGCADIMAELGLSSPSEVVSWGFDFGSIEKDPDSKCFMVTAESFANENASNMAIGGEGGELQELMGKFPELDIGGTYSDEYAAGSVSGYEKIEERSREEEIARTAQWGEDGDADYNDATKEMLLKGYTGALSAKEARKLISQGADVNGVIEGTPFPGMLDSMGDELLKLIPELIDNALEAANLLFEEDDIRIEQENLKFEIDFKQFFQYYKVINAKFLANKIGMNPTLLSQYVQGRKKPSDAQTEKILLGIHQIGQELSEINLIHRP